MTLDEAVRVAQAARPALRMSAERFADWLRPRLHNSSVDKSSVDKSSVDKSSVEAWALDDLHLGDLYLACACADGDAAALRVFEAELMTQVPRWLARVGAEVAEVQQQLRERLFCGETPRIHDYSGRGPLGGWLRVAAVRLALNEHRRQDASPRGEVPLPSALDDPELAALQARYQGAFTDAVREGLRRLDDRERVLLKLHLAEAVTLERLAQMFQVDRATVVRWLAAARRKVRAAALDELGRRTDSDSDELMSVLKLLRSRLDVSLGGLLGA